MATARASASRVTRPCSGGTARATAATVRPDASSAMPGMKKSQRGLKSRRNRKCRQPSRQRPGLIGERAQAAGQYDGSCPRDRRAGSRPPSRHGEPGQRAPARHRTRRHGAWMAQFQRCRRGAVVAAPAQPLTGAHPVLVRHGCPRLIPDVPAGPGQPPDEVHVFPDRHVLGEPASRRLPADDQRGPGHVGHPGTRPHNALRRAHVQRRTHLFIPRQPARALLMGDDPGRGRTHGRISEVPEQGRQPGRPGDTVGIHEGHQWRAHSRQAGVAGGAGAAAGVPAQQARPGGSGSGGDRAWVRRSVVHHDHLEGVGDLRHLLAEAGHDALDISFLVMSGQKNAQPGQPPHSPTFPCSQAAAES